MKEWCCLVLVILNPFRTDFSENSDFFGTEVGKKEKQKAKSKKRKCEAIAKTPYLGFGLWFRKRMQDPELSSDNQLTAKWFIFLVYPYLVTARMGVHQHFVWQ